MSRSFQKKLPYLLLAGAALFVLVPLLITAYSRSTEDPPLSGESLTSPAEESDGEAAAKAQSSGSATESSVDDPGVADETVMAGASVQERITDAEGRTPEELSRYIGRVSSSYGYAQEYLSQADVPALIAMLEDPRYIEKWAAIVDLLGFTDTEEESAKALIAFIYRVEDWNHFPYPRNGYEMHCKINAIRSLGFVGGDAANEALHVLITKEGAQKYLNEWSDDALTTTRMNRSFVRGRAAEGLVHTQEASNIQLLDRLYESALAQIRIFDQRGTTHRIIPTPEGEEQRMQTKFYFHMSEALSIRDYIEENGIEAWKSIMNRRDRRRNVILGYGQEYRRDR